MALDYIPGWLRHEVLYECWKDALRWWGFLALWVTEMRQDEMMYEFGDDEVRETEALIIRIVD